MTIQHLEHLRARVVEPRRHSDDIAQAAAQDLFLCKQITPLETAAVTDVESSRRLLQRCHDDISVVETQRYRLLDENRLS
jgi:hypothetical protein